MRKKCYIYTRVSTAAQTEGYSLEAQTERLRKYADYKEMEVVREYCDAGRSGMSIKGRPAFMEMMDDISCEKDEISCVLVFKLSHFGRNAADILKSLQLLMDFDVDLICVEDAIDSSTQGGRLTFAILSAVAEMEHENITVQFTTARMQKLMNGGWPGGGVPYGYVSVNKELVVVPEAADLVRMIYQKYLEPDMMLNMVVGWMNENGYKRVVKGEDKVITSDFVSSVLGNPIYYGMIVYNRRTNVIIREYYSRSREKSKKHMKNMKILFFPALVHLILFFPQWRDWHCGKMISVMRDFCQGRYRQLHIHWKWENIMSIRQCLILYVQGKM